MSNPHGFNPREIKSLTVNNFKIIHNNDHYLIGHKSIAGFYASKRKSTRKFSTISAAINILKPLGVKQLTIEI